MRRFDKKKNMEQANILLEQRRLIEMGLLPEIEHTHQEARQMEDKYNEILNAKAISISAKYFTEDIVLYPKVRVWMGNNGLNNENLSYNLHFKREHSGYSPEEVTVSIYNGGQKINAWKESNISLEDSEISKIFSMVNDASDYIGGVDMDKLSQELMRKLKPNKNRQGLEELAKHSIQHEGLNENELTSKYTTLLDMYKNASREERVNLKPQLEKAAGALGITLDLSK